MIMRIKMIIPAKTPMTIPAIAPPDRLDPEVLSEYVPLPLLAVAVAGIRNGTVLVAPFVVKTVYVEMLVGRMAAETVAVTTAGGAAPPVVAPFDMQTPLLQNWPALQHVVPHWTCCRL